MKPTSYAHNSSNRTLFLLLLTGILSAAIYAAYFLGSFYLPTYYATPHLDLGKITGYTSSAAIQFISAFSLLFALYYCAYRFLANEVTNSTTFPEMPSPEHRRRQRRIILLIQAFGLIFSLILIFVYPIGAADIFDYIFHGRILVHYGQNPFSTLITDFPNDPFYPYPAWKATPSVYGPIWILLSILPSAIGGDDLLLNILLYKALSVLFFAATALLVQHILQRLHPRYAAPGTLLFTWNPLVVYETAANAHNDIAMSFLLALGIYLLVRRQSSLSILAIVASSLMKFVTAALLPLFFAAAIRTLPDMRTRLAFTTKTILPAATLVLALYAPFWVGPATIPFKQRQELFTSSFPTLLVLSLEPRLGPATARLLVTVTSVIAFSLIFVWLLIRLQPGLVNVLKSSFTLIYLYLLFLCPWFQPWYLLWIIPLASLIPSLDIADRAVLFSYTAVMSYFVFIYLWIWNWNEYDALALQSRAVAVIYSLPIFLTAKQVASQKRSYRRAEPRT